ncbi:MAG: aminotransferase class I/II-fold pyridoxal phosphate-dependent enzyme [Tissierellia bacterium]|nr:aminotransferase class I/II-fold pyridoxal phosphate-dependent enzyme [Tissierellia bacterium]
MKKEFLARRYRSIESTAMGDSDTKVQAYDDLINFSLGDPDLTTPEIIIERAFADARAGHTHYTGFAGDLELIDAIREFYGEEYGLTPRQDEIMVTTSACHGMWLSLEAILDQGDEVLIPEPYFTPYPSQVRLAGGVPVFVPTHASEGFKLTPQAVEAAITQRTKAMILNTPNNPTGACLGREELIALGRVAKEHDLIIIADDIYTEFSYGAPFVPIGSLEDFKERTVTLRSFSKNYAMTGWRLGYIFADANFIHTVREINENNVFTAPSISQRGGIYAIKHRGEFQEELVGTFKRRTFHAYERLRKLKNVAISEPQGTFYLFPDIRKTGLSSQEVADKILEEAHVLVIPGTAFGQGGEGFLRLAVTVGEDKIDEAFDRMAAMEIFQ